MYIYFLNCIFSPYEVWLCNSTYLFFLWLFNILTTTNGIVSSFFELLRKSKCHGNNPTCLFLLDLFYLFYFYTFCTTASKYNFSSFTLMILYQLEAPFFFFFTLILSNSHCQYSKSFLFLLLLQKQKRHQVDIASCNSKAHLGCIGHGACK